MEFLAIFHVKFPLWLAYDHWTGLKKAFEVVGRAAVHASDPTLVPGTKAFSDALAAVLAHPTTQMVANAHALLNAPTIGGVELGFNLPAFLIALVITTVLVIGIKESANFNAGIVVLKLAVVLFVLGLGSHYVNKANWGSDWHTFAPFGMGGIGPGGWVGVLLVHWVRRGFDDGTGGEESAAGYADWDHSLAADAAPYFISVWRRC